MVKVKSDRAGVAVIGGSGFYQIEGIQNLHEQIVETPFGKPSAKIVCGELNGTPVFFLARHGRAHTLSPSEVNYRANIYALKSLDAQWCIAVSAVGSLREEIRPGDMLVPDQLIDRTRGRVSTFFEDGLVAHVGFADPYCPVLRTVLVEAARQSGETYAVNVHDGGTYICMEGPAFSTRAESNIYRQLGGSVIGMTNLPEAKLAREAEISYASLALVTDYDCWRQDGDDVDVAKVLERLRAQTESAKRIVARAICTLASKRPSSLACEALKNAFLTRFEDVKPATIDKLEPFLRKYL
jgi:5'-methylthioadenosine phosphorylase